MSLLNRVTKLEQRLAPPGRFIITSYYPDYETYEMALERARPYGPEDTVVVCALVDFCASQAIGVAESAVRADRQPARHRASAAEPAEEVPPTSAPTYRFTSW